MPIVDMMLANLRLAWYLYNDDDLNALVEDLDTKLGDPSILDKVSVETLGLISTHIDIDINDNNTIKTIFMASQKYGDGISFDSFFHLFKVLKQIPKSKIKYFKRINSKNLLDKTKTLLLEENTEIKKSLFSLLEQKNYTEECLITDDISDRHIDFIKQSIVDALNEYDYSSLKIKNLDEFKKFICFNANEEIDLCKKESGEIKDILIKNLNPAILTCQEESNILNQALIECSNEEEEKILKKRQSIILSAFLENSFNQRKLLLRLEKLENYIKLVEDTVQEENIITIPYIFKSTLLEHCDNALSDNFYSTLDKNEDLQACKLLINLQPYSCSLELINEVFPKYNFINMIFSEKITPINLLLFSYEDMKILSQRKHKDKRNVELKLSEGLFIKKLTKEIKDSILTSNQSIPTNIQIIIESTIRKILNSTCEEHVNALNHILIEVSKEILEEEVLARLNEHPSILLDNQHTTYIVEKLIPLARGIINNYEFINRCLLNMSNSELEAEKLLMDINSVINRVEDTLDILENAARCVNGYVEKVNKDNFEKIKSERHPDYKDDEDDRDDRDDRGRDDESRFELDKATKDLKEQRERRLQKKEEERRKREFKSSGCDDYSRKPDGFKQDEHKQDEHKQDKIKPDGYESDEHKSDENKSDELPDGKGSSALDPKGKDTSVMKRLVNNIWFYGSIMFNYLISIILCPVTFGYQIIRRGVNLLGYGQRVSFWFFIF